jgi:chromosome segregation ATPase
MRTLTVFLLALTSALAAPNDELAAWAKQDCDDYRTLVTQIDHAKSAHDVAAAMRENVRRQRQTINTLLRFARSHLDLRDAAQLGLSEDGQQQSASTRALSAELTATQQRLTHCLDSVGSAAQQQMVAVLRKYHEDAEVKCASRALHEMWAENDHSLLEVLGQR